MNKLIYGIAAATVLVPTLALASPGDDGCIGNCPQGGNGGGPTEITNTNENYNDSSAVANSDSSSSADSTATGIGVGGGATVGVAVETGPTVSGSVSNASGGAGGDGGNASSTAYGGSGGDSYSGSYSDGGDAVAVTGDATASGGNSAAHTGDNTVGVSIADNSSYSVEYEEAAARAANVYTAVCQNGGSAQGAMGGFGVTNQDVICEHLKIAAVLRDAYVFEMKYGVYEECTHDEENHETHCTNEQAEFYRGAYHEHMTEAIQAMEAYEEVGLLDKMAGALVRPMALIGALIWLI